MRIYFVYVCLRICKSISDQTLTKKVLEDILIEKLHPLQVKIDSLTQTVSDFIEEANR